MDYLIEIQNSKGDTLTPRIDAKMINNLSTYLEENVIKIIEGNEVSKEEIKNLLEELLKELAPNIITIIKENEVSKEELKKMLEEFLNEVSPGEVVKSGTSSFLGDGKEVIIKHELGRIPKFCSVTPILNPKGFLGEVWYRYTDTDLIVGNTGSYTGEFTWSVK